MGYRKNLVPVLAFAEAIIMLAALSTTLAESERRTSDCHFPAIYNFGDSNSDTGGVSAIYGPIPPPHGITFFHHPAGRWGDGRLMIDFIAEKLGLPYLDSYLDSIGTNYRHGANFAMSGSTIELTIINGRFIDAGFNQISLTNEIGQFEQFKNRTIKLYHRKGTSGPRVMRHNLPRPKDFFKAIYTTDIGQNDLYFRLTTLGVDNARAAVPDLAKNSSLALLRLYKLGARNFWIHNTGPIGCLPILVANETLRQQNNTDELGCIKSYNQVAKEFNKQLKDKVVSELRAQLQDATLIYVDIYSARHTLIKDAEKYGFVDPLGSCCRNGTCCKDPSKYISWDTIHFTEAANRWVTQHTLDGSFSDPPVPITKAC